MRELALEALELEVFRKSIIKLTAQTMKNNDGGDPKNDVDDGGDLQNIDGGDPRTPTVATSKT